MRVFGGTETSDRGSGTDAHSRFGRLARIQRGNHPRTHDPAGRVGAGAWTLGLTLSVLARCEFSWRSVLGRYVVEIIGIACLCQVLAGMAMGPFIRRWIFG